MTEVITNSGAQLTPTFTQRGQAGFNYYEDKQGNLWGGRKGARPNLIAYKGKWNRRDEVAAGDGSLQDRFAKKVPTAPEQPAPEASPATEPKAKRRFAFSFPVQLAGEEGTLSIEADTLKEAKDTLEEVKATAKKYPHLGIVVGRKPKPEDEYFVILADGSAFCRKHQAPMKLRQKQGDEWWSHDTGKECFCRGRPGKDSPGWTAE